MLTEKDNGSRLLMITLIIHTYTQRRTSHEKFQCNLQCAYICI